MNQVNYSLHSIERLKTKLFTLLSEESINRDEVMDLVTRTFRLLSQSRSLLLVSKRASENLVWSDFVKCEHINGDLISDLDNEIIELEQQYDDISNFLSRKGGSSK